MLIHGIPPEFRDGVHLFILNRHTPSGESRVNRVTQFRTNGVHCREFAGTGPVNLKLVPNECCLGRFGQYGPIIMRLSFPHPLLTTRYHIIFHYSYINGTTRALSCSCGLEHLSPDRGLCKTSCTFRKSLLFFLVRKSSLASLSG